MLVLGAIAMAAACSSSAPNADPSRTSGSDAAIDETTAPPTTATPTTTTIPLDQSRGPVADPVRHPASAKAIYFVMPDRFENGDPANDTAGVDGDVLDHGFDPTRRGYHHGGDLAGLSARLPYIADMGIEALWITPVFTNRFVQGDGTIEGSTSSYHGYWQVDFERIDPHLGTADDMKALIDDAHALGLDVYFDIVVNHTGDVIGFAEGAYSYLSTENIPFRDATGVAFDPAAIDDPSDWPELDVGTSFPYTPVFVPPELATIKNPEWLNDPALYHNRGNSTFQGESSLYGDFFGLDDLFTEHPRVIEGMIELYGDMIETYDIDGFRIDTMKHVDLDFWAQFAPAIRERAAALGKPDFFFFGEVFSEDPALGSSHTAVGVPATLDFIVNGGIDRYVSGGPADAAAMAQAFDQDDWYTDTDNNATMQVTFYGNHDEGRMGHKLNRAEPGADDLRLLARSRVAFDLSFLSRGAPVVYYGDEQGFTGDGGDQLARQDMFPSQVPEYLDDDLIGTDATTADSNFDPGHPLYQHVQYLTKVRREHPTFSTGAQIVHEPVGSVFAFSRFDRDERVEYVVVTNSDPVSSNAASIDLLTPSATFTQIGGEGLTASTDADGVLTVDVPPIGTLVFRADERLEPPATEATIRIDRPTTGTELIFRRYRIQATVGDDRYAEVTFAVSVDGADHEVIGVDDAPPYRVYWDNSDLADGTEVEIVATVTDGSGRLRSDVVTATVGERAG